MEWVSNRPERPERVAAYAAGVFVNQVGGEQRAVIRRRLPGRRARDRRATQEYVTRVALGRAAVAPRFMMGDPDLRRPGFDVRGEAEAFSVASVRMGHRRFAPGASRIDTLHPAPPGSAAPAGKGKGRHDPKVASAIARRMAFAEAVQARTVSFETNALDLTPGMVVAIGRHPHPMLDPDRTKLLVTGVEMTLDPDKPWRARCRAVFADMPYKPARRMPKPVVHGLQCAVVQGPPGQEIHTDDYGRIKVRPAWAHGADNDESTTAWMRVALVWTGAGFGLWVTPRVGQEVLIGFLEGNPDEPIVVGALSNAITPPPYPLPRHQTKTVLRTRSSPGSDGYSELSFEDRRNEELLFMRAQRDRESYVRREDRTLVEGSRMHRIGGDEHVCIGGEKREHIDGDEHRSVVGDAPKGAASIQSRTEGGTTSRLLAFM